MQTVRVISVGNSMTFVKAHRGTVVLTTWCDGVRGEATTPYALHLTRDEAIAYANGILYGVRDMDDAARKERDVVLDSSAGQPERVAGADRIIEQR